MRDIVANTRLTLQGLFEGQTIERCVPTAMSARTETQEQAEWKPCGRSCMAAPMPGQAVAHSGGQWIAGIGCPKERYTRSGHHPIRRLAEQAVRPEFPK